MSLSEQDPRTHLDGRIQENQLMYSLVQLRLVGLLLMLLLLGRLLVFLVTGMHVSPIERLSALGALANWLPLLPLAISLYLLGAGRRRLPRELAFTVLLHRALLPLAGLLMLVLPAAILIELRHGVSANLADLSPYQEELLSPLRNATAIVLSMIAGLGLILLQRQASSEMRRHGSTPKIFFKADRLGSASVYGHRRRRPTG